MKNEVVHEFLHKKTIKIAHSISNRKVLFIDLATLFVIKENCNFQMQLSRSLSN